MEIDIHDLEDSFAVQVKAKKENLNNENNNNNKQKFVSVLDPKRSNAIAIMVSRLPETSLMISAINHLDQKVIKRDMIPMILSNVCFFLFLFLLLFFFIIIIIIIIYFLFILLVIIYYLLIYFYCFNFYYLLFFSIIKLFLK